MSSQDLTDSNISASVEEASVSNQHPSPPSDIPDITSSTNSSSVIRSARVEVEASLQEREPEEYGTASSCRVQDFTISRSRGHESTSTQSQARGTEGFDIQNHIAQIQELEAQVLTLRMHLARVTVYVRSEDGSLRRRLEGVAGENQGRIIITDFRPGDSVEIEFVRRDMTLQEPEASVDGAISQSLGNTDDIAQDAQGPRAEGLEGGDAFEVVMGSDTIANPTASHNLAETDAPGCSICFETISTRSKLMPCGHEFDALCIVPWFNIIYVQRPQAAEVICPLCRQRVLSMRHSYNPEGEFRTMGIGTEFRARQSDHGRSRRFLSPVMVPRHSPGANSSDNSARTHRSNNARRRYVPGRPQDLILPASDVDYLDFDGLSMMGPHELEDFVSDLWQLSQAQRDRVDNEHMTNLADRLLAFRSLGFEGFNLERAMRRPESFSGYNQDGSLDFDSINRMGRREIADFRDAIVALGELERLMPLDVERFQQRFDALQQENHRRRVGPQNRRSQRGLQLEDGGGQAPIQTRSLAPGRLSPESQSPAREGL